MDRALGLFLIGLVFGGGLGFFVAAAYGVTLDGHDHGAHNHSDAAGATHESHDQMQVIAPSDDAPRLTADLTPDPVSGWNLHLKAANFRFAPENAGLADVEGEGHAHVYVDGVKIARIYGPWMHLTLPEKAREVRVALYSNSHRALAVGETPVAVSLPVGN